MGKSSASKLTEAQQLQVLERLCAGQSNPEILAWLEGEGVTVTAQAIDYYRDKFETEIDAAQLKALARAKRRGWGVVDKRIQFICDQLDALEKQREGVNAAQWVHYGLGKEYRELAGELRKELGQEKPTQLELGGKGGTPLQILVVPCANSPVPEAAPVSSE